MELPTKAPPRCLPAPAIFAVVPPALPALGTGLLPVAPAPWAWAVLEGAPSADRDWRWRRRRPRTSGRSPSGPNPGYGHTRW